MLPLVSRAAVSATRSSLGTKCILPVRNSVQYTVVSGPPQTRVSFAEKAILGTIMCTSVCILPAYILVNLKHYTAGQDKS